MFHLPCWWVGFSVVSLMVYCWSLVFLTSFWPLTVILLPICSLKLPPFCSNFSQDMLLQGLYDKQRTTWVIFQCTQSLLQTLLAQLQRVVICYSISHSICELGWAEISLLMRGLDCGADRYMAPEVFLHKSYDKSVDVFSFAITVQEVCSLHCLHDCV
jgi:serine/threonine protein kinase